MRNIIYNTNVRRKVISILSGDKIVICSGDNKKGNIIYSIQITCDNAMDVIMLWMCPVTMKDNFKTKLVM